VSYLNSPRTGLSYGHGNVCVDSSRPKKWKTTSKKMEDNLKQKLMEDNLKKCKTTSKKVKVRRP
jgi:hypothetical protein